MLILYVAAGGAFGSVMRYLMIQATNAALGKEFPYGTLLVNVLGCFLMGVAIAFLASILPRGRELHLLLAVGALGGFTTFSAFAYDVVLLLDRGEIVSALIYVLASVVVSVLALWAGMMIFRGVFAA